MPHFTLSMSPNGPLMDAFVGVSQPRRNALTAAGQTVPNWVQIRALLDTGASGSCVDPSVLSSLALNPSGSIPMITPSTGTTPHVADQYDVSLMIPCLNQAPLVFHTIGVACVELLLGQGFHALIGRDILQQCVLTYNGNRNWFTLAY
jgi:hypothetical protein